MFSWFGRPKRRYVAPPGHRIYAIGDIHGCYDQFAALLQRIEADHLARKPAELHIVLLGDLINRGPDSARVVDLAIKLAQDHSVSWLMGNHEEILREVAAGRTTLVPMFLSMGGLHTLASYGVAMEDLNRSDAPAIVGHVQTAIPAVHLDFLERGADYRQFGDFAFVHAGIRPGIALSRQSERDLRWIRTPFLDANKDFGIMVVHGHTVVEKPEIRDNRIGIDTGAHESGRLTTIGIENGDFWFLEENGKIQMQYN